MRIDGCHLIRFCRFEFVYGGFSQQQAIAGACHAGTGFSELGNGCDPRSLVVSPFYWCLVFLGVADNECVRKYDARHTKRESGSVHENA